MRKSVCRILFCCVFGMLYLGCSQQEDEATSQPVEQGIPKLTLSLQHLDVEAKRLDLLLEVTNQGEHPLAITRLQEEGIGKCDFWKGWLVLVTDQDGRGFGPSCGREADALIGKEDLVQILPGEHFSVPIHLGQWRRTTVSSSVEAQFYKPFELIRESGIYDIIVRLNIFTDLLIGNPTPVSWTGEVFSNTVQVEIQYRNVPIPKRLNYPERAVQEHYVCQCRVDCDRIIPENPCLQLPEEQQSQFASAEADRRRDAATLARAKAVSLLGGAPRKYQPCFCSDSKGTRSGKDLYPN